jgi:hypothetical protein
VTLCAATSINVAATVWALRRCLQQIEFADCRLFTDRPPTDLDSRIQVVRINRLSSAKDYSHFVLRELAGLVESSHVLLVQWDGFVLDAEQWDSAFLACDYIGAPWPQFGDGHDVGNGGFSLRSRKLLEACSDARFQLKHPEDLAICRLNRMLLEREHGIRFAERSLANRFAFERARPNGRTFGFHGVFNMIPALGTDRFWERYQDLDDKSTAFVDYPLLFRQLGTGWHSIRRRLQLTKDWIAAGL